MSKIKVPSHIGIVLDGNRRWARANHLPKMEGHRRGMDNLRTVARYTFSRGVRYLSAFVFSTENWSRSQREVNYLMGLISKAIDGYLEEFHGDGIKIVILGRRNGLRRSVLRAIRKAETTTRNNTNGTLALCFNYGGQEELVDAARSLVSSGQRATDITAETLTANLYCPEIPNVDMLIRTSGEYRTSGFMLYRSAYAELYFTEKHWPEFTPADLDLALDEFERRERRFGK